MSEDLIRRIDADALMQEIMKARASLQMLDNTQSADKMLQGLRMVEILVENAPTIEPKRGEWIRTGRTNIYGGIEVQCSNCGDRVMVQHLEDEWYCRHCGADMGMKGADDE